MSEHHDPDPGEDEPPARARGDDEASPGPFADDPLIEPLDAADPRFTGFESPEAPARQRELVESRGPGHSPMDKRVRVIRAAIPTIAIAGVVAVAAVFWSALSSGEGGVVVGDAEEVAEAVTDRPRRVCRGDGPPCAWLTRVDGELLALSTSGSVQGEYGRQGVGWCPTSGYFGANSTGSRYDPAGRLVTGPAPRGLDRFGLRRDDDGRLVVEFSQRTAGPRAGDGDTLSPAGSRCDEIPFDRDPDLELSG
jgi:hypothetical protein